FRIELLVQTLRQWSALSVQVEIVFRVPRTFERPLVLPLQVANKILGQQVRRHQTGIPVPSTIRGALSLLKRHTVRAARCLKVAMPLLGMFTGAFHPKQSLIFEERVSDVWSKYLPQRCQKKLTRLGGAPSQAFPIQKRPCGFAGFPLA